MKLIEHIKIAKDIKILEHNGEKYKRCEYTNGEIEWVAVSYDGEVDAAMLEREYILFVQETFLATLFKFGTKESDVRFPL